MKELALNIEKEDKPDISVIIACYNARPTLERAVKSVLSQEGVSFECIIINDCSTDGTQNVSLDLLAHPRVKLHTLPVNMGPSAARNIGLQQAQGDWVAILDADDIFLSGRLLTLVKIAQSTGAEAVYDNLLLLDSEHQSEMGKAFIHLKDKPEKISLYDFLVHSVPSIRRNGIGYIKPLIRRKFLLDHDLMYNESYRVGEDFEFYVRMLQAGALFVGVDRMLYGYTITKGSLSRSGRWTFPVLIDICDELEKSLPCRSEEQHALLKVRHRLVQKYNALIFFDMLKSKRTFELISMLGRNPKVIFYAIEHLVTAIFKRFLQMYKKRSFDILP